MENNSMKKLIYTAAGIVLLIVAGWIVLNKLLDPNLYKPQIIAEVKRVTGRDLSINGPMDWSLVPLGFELADVELGNPSGFQNEPFAKLKSAEIQVQLRPLFSKQLIVDNLVIDGLTLNLTRNAAGEKNWTGLTKAEAPAQKNAARKAEKKQKRAEEAAEKSASQTKITLGKVTVKNATLNWKDNQSGQAYSIHNFKMETGRIGTGEPFDVHCDFGLQRGRERQISKVEFQSTYHPLPDGFRLSGLEFSIDESKMTGQAELTRTPVPVWNFDFALNELDVDRYLPKSKKNEKDQSGESPAVVVAGMNGKGTIRIGKLKVKGIKLSDVVIQSTIADGIFHLGPDKAKLYNGTYEGQTMIDASGPRIGLQLNEKFSGINAQALFQDMQILQKVSGVGSIHIQLNTHGSKPDDFSRSLTGTIGLDLSNGKIQGIDLEKTLRKAKTLQARIKGQSIEEETSPTDQTLFKKMTATIRFANGIGKTENVRIEGNVIDAAGGGTVDLIHESIDMRLKATITEPGKEKGTTVPVLVRGKLEDPKFGVDWNEIVESAVERNIENQLNKALKKFFKKDKNR